MSAPSLPVTDLVSDPFWEGARAGKLMIQRCPVTGRHQWYPRAHSLHASGAVPDWVEASGRGTVFSFSTIHRGGQGDAPYVCALVMLEEDVLMLTRLEGIAADAIRVGMPVEVAFGAIAGSPVLPLFRPVEARA
ncbi:OB-fold domain-containing protein [Ancylobacter sonchi]|uniref:Zn-ribbon domain-containing OB-fold protein n=1 Tax=Ancylobacter sonchi TaxID=1937790 RepID=UPI001BD264DE|nr:OB-fold domain-containing protein [Ancylobacter sonchi]MBS7534763.1 OB-fold domain-containing protein [Ancylobacter sonchi]